MDLLETYLSKNYKTDKNTVHCYIDKVYNNLFTDNTITNVLEIGAFDGGSALLWKDFFSQANIDILDINQCNAILNQERINHIVCDAYNEASLNNLKTYDIIIDDGPHTLNSMIFFVEHYTKLLKKTGIAIIEDVQSYDWYEVILNKVPEGFLTEIVDLRHIKNRYDDMVLIIKNNKGNK